MIGFGNRNLLLGLNEISTYLKTDFSTALQLFKDGIKFIYQYERMYFRPAIILRELEIDELLRECLRAHYEDLDRDEKGSENRTFYNPNDGNKSTSYAKYSEFLRDIYFSTHGKKLGSFEKAFMLSTYGSYYMSYQIAFPANDANLLIAPHSNKKKYSGRKCKLLKISDDLSLLKNDEYKYSDIYTYEQVLLVDAGIIEGLL